MMLCYAALQIVIAITLAIMLKVTFLQAFSRIILSHSFTTISVNYL